MKEKILLVDDEPMVLDVISTILKRQGFEVVSADSGQCACERAEEEEFDLICTDINMPGMDGFNLIDILKEKDLNLPIVIMTAHADLNVATEAVSHGIEGLIHKPFTNAKFVDVVGNALKKGRLKKENSKLKSIYPFFKVNHSLMHHDNISQLLDVILGVVQKESGADSISIALKNDDSSFSIVAAMGLGDAYGKGHKLSSDGIAVQVAKSGQPLVLQHGREGKFQNIMERDELCSAMIIPLEIKNKVIGVLSISNKGGHYHNFTKADLDFMGIVAGQASMSLRNEELFEELEDFFFGSIRSFSSAIDAKSSWTAGHSDRVTSYSCILGWHMGLSENELEDLEVAAILHDIGKIGVSEYVLEKPDRLTKDEFAMMKQHPGRGAEILEHVKPLKHLIPAVRAHHERFDGSGYPDGLSGKKIPLIARILTVADSYDAMKVDRPYRKGHSNEYIVEEFIKCAGTQFDHDVVEPFLDILGNDKLHGELLLKIPHIRKFYGSQSRKSRLFLGAGKAHHFIP